MRKLFFIVTALSSLQFQADIASQGETAKKEMQDISQEKFVQQLQVGKITLAVQDSVEAIDQSNKSLALLATAQKLRKSMLEDFCDNNQVGEDYLQLSFDKKSLKTRAMLASLKYKNRFLDLVQASKDEFSCLADSASIVQDEISQLLFDATVMYHHLMGEPMVLTSTSGEQPTFILYHGGPNIPDLGKSSLGKSGLGGVSKSSSSGSGSYRSGGVSKPSRTSNNNSNTSSNKSSETSRPSNNSPVNNGNNPLSNNYSNSTARHRRDTPSLDKFNIPDCELSKSDRDLEYHIKRNSGGGFSGGGGGYHNNSGSYSNSSSGSGNNRSQGHSGRGNNLPYNHSTGSFGGGSNNSNNYLSGADRSRHHDELLQVKKWANEKPIEGKKPSATNNKSTNEIGGKYYNDRDKKAIEAQASKIAADFDSILQSVKAEKAEKAAKAEKAQNEAKAEKAEKEAEVQKAEKKAKDEKDASDKDSTAQGDATRDTDNTQENNTIVQATEKVQEDRANKETKTADVNVPALQDGSGKKENAAPVVPADNKKSGRIAKIYNKVCAGVVGLFNGAEKNRIPVGDDNGDKEKIAISKGTDDKSGLIKTPITDPILQNVLAKELNCSTTVIVNENGSNTVIYEGSSDNNHFISVYEYTQIDGNLSAVSGSGYAIEHRSDNEASEPSQPSGENNQQGNSSQDNSSQDAADRAQGRGLDYHNDVLNNQINGHENKDSNANNNSRKNSVNKEQAALNAIKEAILEEHNAECRANPINERLLKKDIEDNRSKLYIWCKKQKLALVGPSSHNMQEEVRKSRKELDEKIAQAELDAAEKKAQGDAAANNSSVDQSNNGVENTLSMVEPTSTDKNKDTEPAVNQSVNDPFETKKQDESIDPAVNPIAPTDNGVVTPPSGVADQNKDAVPQVDQSEKDPLESENHDKPIDPITDQAQSTDNGVATPPLDSTGQNNPEVTQSKSPVAIEDTPPSGAVDPLLTNPHPGDISQSSQPQPPAAKSWWDTFFPPANPGDNKLQPPTPPSSRDDKDDAPYVPDWSRSKNDFVSDPLSKMSAGAADKLRKDLLSNNGKQVSKEDKAMVDYMVNRMMYAQNDATVQLAQAGLQAFKDAKNAQSDEERDYYAQKAREYQDAMKKHVPDKSIGQQAKPINPSIVDAMIQDYAGAITGHKNNGPSGLQFTDAAYLERMQKRHDALVKSKEELRTNNLPQRDYKMSADTRGYLMANNLNYATFDSMKATSYQHCLAQENLNIVESMARVALDHRNQPGIKECSNQMCHLAIASQQLNQQSQIQNATAITDLNVLFVKACLPVFGIHLPNPLVVRTVVGAVKGGSTSLYNWATFAGNVGTGDKATLKKISDDLNALGHGLGAVSKELTEAIALYTQLPNPYPSKISPKEILDQIEVWKKKSDERFDKKLNGAIAVVQAGQTALMNMMQKSIEDNIAGITEGIVDSLIIGGIAKSVGFVAGIVGNKCIDVSRGINMMPPNLLNATPQFINGQAIALVDGASINLGEAIAAGAQGLLEPLSDAAILAAQANNACNKAKGSGGGTGGKQGGDKGKPAVEPVKGSPEWKEKFPNGEFRPSAKHNPNSPDYIGKPPRDGQAALNSSFDVEKSKQRVAIQDDKVVVLKFEEDGIYHGYIVEDITTLPKKVRDVLVENGFMKDLTSKKLIKR